MKTIAKAAFGVQGYVWRQAYPGDYVCVTRPSSIGDCSAVPGTTDNDYGIAYDMVSGRWSNEVPIDSDCASF
jgi:hypothetical protein